MVTYTALGNAPYLPWFLHRLAAQGVVAYPTPHHLAQHGWLPAAWQGFLADNTLLDLTTDNTEQLLATQTLAQQHGKTLIEVSGAFLPAGAAHGFMLLVGYSGELPNTAQLWLDAAAPAPGAWLPCGPVGSARFTRYILDAMRFAWQQALADLTPQSSQDPLHIDWQQLFQKQLTLAENMLALARQYLKRHGLDTETLETSTVLSDFSTPAREQAHFAANLARMIVLALGLGQAVQEIFSTIMQEPSGN